MARADEERRTGGNEVIAAELLWGAFAHCLITVAQNEGLSHNSHEEFRLIAEQLAISHNAERWRSDFGAAQELHVHFYHGDLDSSELHTHTRAASRAVRQLLQMLQTEL